MKFYKTVGTKSAMLVLFFTLLSGCSSEPTCAELGGNRVFSHNVIVMMPVGKVMTPSTIPQYKCVINK